MGGLISRWQERANNDGPSHELTRLTVRLQPSHEGGRGNAALKIIPSDQDNDNVVAVSWVIERVVVCRAILQPLKRAAELGRNIYPGIRPIRRCDTPKWRAAVVAKRNAVALRHHHEVDSVRVR